MLSDGSVFRLYGDVTRKDGSVQEPMVTGGGTASGRASRSFERSTSMLGNIKSDWNAALLRLQGLSQLGPVAIFEECEYRFNRRFELQHEHHCSDSGLAREIVFRRTRFDERGG